MNEDDYIDFIMEVINTAITVARESKDDLNDLTLYQRFYSFSEKLVYMSSNKDCSE
jgi:hypothetical protein